jgi:hypothetical protein
MLSKNTVNFVFLLDFLIMEFPHCNGCGSRKTHQFLTTRYFALEEDLAAFPWFFVDSRFLTEDRYTLNTD